MKSRSSWILFSQALFLKSVSTLYLYSSPSTVVFTSSLSLHSHANYAKQTNSDMRDEAQIWASGSLGKLLKNTYKKPQTTNNHTHKTNTSPISTNSHFFLKFISRLCLKHWIRINAEYICISLFFHCCSENLMPEKQCNTWKGTIAPYGKLLQFKMESGCSAMLIIVIPVTTTRAANPSLTAASSEPTAAYFGVCIQLAHNQQAG